MKTINHLSHQLCFLIKVLMLSLIYSADINLFVNTECIHMPSSLCWALDMRYTILSGYF